MFVMMTGTFVAGLLAGLITAALISGLADRVTEWRKRKHEQKSVLDFFQRTGGGDHHAGRAEHGAGQESDLGQRASDGEQPDQLGADVPRRGVE